MFRDEERKVSDEEDRRFMDIHRDIDDDAFYALSQEDRGRCYLLFMIRPAADMLGYWRTCRLPSCRRAKACRGTAPPESCRPPCTAGRFENILSFCSQSGQRSDVAPAHGPGKSTAGDARKNNLPKGGPKRRKG